MNINRVALLLFLLPAAVFADGEQFPAVIPLPQKMERQEGEFPLAAATRIYVDSAARATGVAFAERLRPATGYPLKISGERSGRQAVSGAILLTTRNADTNLGPEGYELTVAANSVVIRAPAPAGLFYGVQTLLQLLPPEVFSTTIASNTDWRIPCVRIRDWPRFSWRGFMLDVSRHFFTKAEVETLLDAMALHKLNVFHWHLTDDQGWRIQIKKYPRLTEVGAWRAGVGFGFPSNAATAYGPDGRYGGFYTQNDIRDVVRYAAARHITIVPEIEMPGHSTAALAAYPEFSCTGGPFVPGDSAGIFKGIYDPAREDTYRFLDDVLSEVAPLFPGRYLHIGGDEVPKDTWQNSADCRALMRREGLKNEEELQGWFTRRMEKIVRARGHAMIGWSEILHGGLPGNAAVMDWAGGAREAAGAGHDVVMTPPAFCYFDFYQSSNRVAEPRAATWGGPLTLRQTYAFEPMPAHLPPAWQPHILGAQGNLWTEQIPNLQHAEYMTFPRACALAEVTWSAPEARNWEDFTRRLRIHLRRLDNLNLNYRPLDVP